MFDNHRGIFETLREMREKRLSKHDPLSLESQKFCEPEAKSQGERERERERERKREKERLFMS